MKLTESLAVVFILLGFILILSGISQGSAETMTRMVDGQEIILNNKYSYGLNMREFIGIICLIGALISAIAGGGKSTVTMGGVETE